MLKKIPKNEQPYEKFELYGVENLTSSELLAIILRTGTKEMSCLEISRNLMQSENSTLEGFKLLDYLSLSELQKLPGIGRVKSIQIKALLEIAKRINKEESEIKPKIKSPQDVYNVVKLEMENKSQEIIKTIILNRKNIVQSVITNAIGGQSKIVITPKEILSEPIKQMASSIILVHNHPSGEPTPSKEDVMFTKNIMNLASLFDINVLDHLVIGKNCFKSLKEMNLM